MTRLRSRRDAPAAALLALGIALGIGLTGCGPSPAPSAAPTDAAESGQAAPATDAPDDQPAAIPATCTTVLAPDAYTTLEADGLEQRAPTLFDPIAVRISEAGGLVCSWGKPDSDNVVDVAQIAVAGDDAAWTDALTEAGYTPSDDPVPGGYRGQPDAANGISPVVVIEGGTVTYLSTPAFAGFLLPAS
ncbi:hypothetical protein [Agromyces marinus]|uniref:DUF3558 domain-containing protein n=1 Tax=Agromyces marinus TaxID=1389020 RepID=A0ABN6YG95_9MICO|nr:hypothetical protein [Agromyces marinus]UIP59963.1 hypothetical protein DSM26151_28770 [Agromyces marinus]BDZ54932.1 hypothetical protein GCM10025870_20050 [Agromyces marinus]